MIFLPTPEKGIDLELTRIEKLLDPCKGRSGRKIERVKKVGREV